ncbi:MAG: hypothetical protein Q8O59_00490, partial [bacterium]|nr:hypothetical protein [bacterium]
MKFLNKIIEYGLYLLIFLLPLQTRWIIKAGELNGGPWEYGTYSLYATDILLIIILLLFVIVIASDRRERSNLTYSDDNQRLLRRPEYGTPRNDKVTRRFVGGLLLMSAVSVFFAANRPLALYKLGWLMLGVGLFWLVIKADYNRLKLIYAMLAGIFFQAVLGIW